MIIFEFPPLSTYQPRIDRIVDAFNGALAKSEIRKIYKLSDPLWQEIRNHPDKNCPQLIDKMDAAMKNAMARVTQ